MDDAFNEMCEKFSIKIITTASYSKWKNGLCERHKEFLTRIFPRLWDYTKCEDEVALAWAGSIKNSPANHNGFSSAKIVFFLNPNLPNNMNIVLPALEGPLRSYDLASHIPVLHTARKVFVSVESPEKTKMALKNNWNY